MSRSSDPFRDFGILPEGMTPPPEKVRSFLPTGHIIGQYVFSVMMIVFGLGMAAVFWFGFPFPLNVPAAAVALAVFGGLIFLATRNDYSWVELDGAILRAKHLYTGRIVERSIEEIDDLLTLVLQVRTLSTMIVDAWLGRVRGVEIRFRDKRTPLRVCRTDPAMRNAKELIEAVIFRMSQQGEVDAEVIDFGGKPLVRRIFWKSPAV
jgi:hypothetical protein